jgi:hypothetical protein
MSLGQVEGFRIAAIKINFTLKNVGRLETYQTEKLPLLLIPSGDETIGLERLTCCNPKLPLQATSCEKKTSGFLSANTSSCEPLPDGTIQDGVAQANPHLSMVRVCHGLST